MHGIDQWEKILNGKQHEDLMFGRLDPRIQRWRQLHSATFYLVFYIANQKIIELHSFKKFYNNESVNKICKIM